MCQDTQPSGRAEYTAGSSESQALEEIYGVNKVPVNAGIQGLEPVQEDYVPPAVVG